MIQSVWVFLLVVGLVGATVSATPTKKCAYSDYRLPKHIVPKHYKLFLTLDTMESRYEGATRIQLEVTENTIVPRDLIVLNTHAGVKVTNVNYIELEDKTSSSSNLRLIDVMNFCQDYENELLVVQLQEGLADDARGELRVWFETEIRNDKTGIYMSKYKSMAGVDSYQINTDFKPNKARRAFPCFDEPAFKATFEITLAHDPATVALSNTDLVTTELYAGLQTSKFMKTPEMSTYLVGFAIGKFNHIESKFFGNRLAIRVYTPVGKSHYAQFALEVAEKAIMHLEKYLTIPFPLMKLDMLAGVQLNSESTENWGLIVFNETSFLFDRENMMPIFRGDVAANVIQAVTKQWFGNLVTLEWWDDLWLQEGFAGWMANSLINLLYPDLQWELNYLIETQQKALEYDFGENAQQIRVAVDRKNVGSFFNHLVQVKSAAVIRMLHDDYIGPGNFKIGIRQYLDENKYKNADAIELWEKLTTLSGLPVEEFIESWTEPLGHPLVSAKLSPDGRLLILEQRPEKSVFSGGKRSSKDPVWIIPVTVHLSIEPLPVVYNLDKPEQEIPLPDGFQPGHNANHWLKINAYSRGFYRVQHTREILFKILKEPCQSMQLSTSDRIGLIDDADAQVRRRVSSSITLSKILKWFEKDTKGSVLGRVARALSHFRPLSGEFATFIGRVFIDAYWRNKLPCPSSQNPGIHPEMGVADSFGLVTVYSFLLQFNYEPLVKGALALFEVKQNKVAPLIRELVYKAVALRGSNAQRNKLQSFLQQESNCEEEINRINAALALVPGRHEVAASSSQSARERPEIFLERMKRAKFI